MFKTKIYGAPGTGKTTRMLDLLEQEVKAGVPVEKIAFITHTVAARLEALDRIKRHMTLDQKQLRYFRTIHGICYSEIGLRKSNVMDVEDYMDFGDDHGLKFSDNFSRDLDVDGLPYGYMHSIGNEILAIRQLAAAKMCAVTELMDEWPVDASKEKMAQVLEEYRKWKYEKAKFDFVDMLQMYMKHGQPIDADVMFIDEAQDLSRQQWQIVDNMMGKCKRVYVAGDDDQSIYSFIGADRYGFLDYAVDKVEVLPKTWRLPDKIWELSQKIIKQVQRRMDKQIETRGTGGHIEYYNSDIDRIKLSSDETTMFVCRHNNQLSEVADRLQHLGVPYQGKGWSPFGSTLGRAVLALLSTSRGQPALLRDAAVVLDKLGLREKAKEFKARARSSPAETIDVIPGVDYSKSFEQLLSSTELDRKRLGIISSIIRTSGEKGISEPPRVSLMTYHASKGREADHVVLLTDCYRSVYQNSLSDDERRVAYVGVTRAKKRLSIVLPQTNLYMRALV